MVRPLSMTTERLRLVTIDDDGLRAMLDGSSSSGLFRWPSWWPDAVDRPHVEVWAERCRALEPASPWRPWALIADGDAMIGHAGFHLPPAPIELALADPSYDGTIDPSPRPGRAVELGYTVFAAWRARGLAAEAAGALVDWAFASGQVGTVLATVAQTNVASFGVLRKVGGFRAIGRCVADDGAAETVLRRDRPASDPATGPTAGR